MDDALILPAGQSFSSFNNINSARPTKVFLELNIINTNARSLRPKTKSLIDNFSELDITFGFLTETWLTDGDAFDQEVEDLLLGSGISVIAKNRRPGTAGFSHGGVALIARAATTKMSRLDFPNPEHFEVVCAKATVHGMPRNFWIISAYIPPGYSVGRARGCMQHISDLILEAKNRDSQAYIILAGDFNQWQVSDYILDYPDLVEAITPPTRGDRRIDKIFVNFGIKSADCIRPLQSEPDREGEVHRSDHDIQLVQADLEMKTIQKWHTHVVRPFTATGKDAFVQELGHVDWSFVLEADGPNKKADNFQLILDNLMDTHFPTKTVRRRDGDLPWFNDVARKKIKKKKAVFRAELDSPRWQALRADLDRYLAKRQEVYLRSQRDKLTGPQASRNFHQNVKAYNSVEKPKQFNIKSLLPDRSDQQAAEEDYFNRTSSEFQPLQPDHIPSTYDRPMALLSPGDVTLLLKRARKPNSMVPGDIFPKLIVPCGGLLSTPLSDIYNTIITTNVWPINWKKEYVTVIPKKSQPQGLEDLRNISCTKFFSKIYLLQNALEEISLKTTNMVALRADPSATCYWTFGRKSAKTRKITDQQLY